MGFRLILECTYANAKSINYWFWPFRPFLDTYLPVWLHELTQDYVDRSTDTWADRQVDKEAPTVGVCVWVQYFACEHMHAQCHVCVQTDMHT